MNEPTVDGHVARRVRRRLKRWGASNRADFPWRRTTSRYRILVAEFMLHRTQAKQVVPVYLEFVRRFPSLRSFAEREPGSADDVLAPLGLNWRVRGMQAALGEIWLKYRSVPADPLRLAEVRGVGPYIAAATVCFSRNTPQLLIDSNTVRVVGRLLGLNLKGEARRRKELAAAIEAVCDPDEPRSFYFALIDLAHAICRPRNPACRQCPLLDAPCLHGQSRLREGGGVSTTVEAGAFGTGGGPERVQFLEEGRLT